MKNLFSLRELSNEEIKRILDDAMAFENGLQYDLSNKIIANLFFEPSTRTQYSFQVAQAKLKMKSINFNPVGSSLTKGESFYDTVKTFASFGIDALVIRHRCRCTKSYSIGCRCGIWYGHEHFIGYHLYS